MPFIRFCDIHFSQVFSKFVKRFSFTNVFPKDLFQKTKKHISSNPSLEHEVNSFSFALGHRQLWWLHSASLQRWIRCSLNGTAMWCWSKHYSRLLFFTHQRPQKLCALLCQSIPRTTFVCTAAKTYKFSRFRRTSQPQTHKMREFFLPYLQNDLESFRWKLQISFASLSCRHFNNFNAVSWMA